MSSSYFVPRDLPHHSLEVIRLLEPWIGTSGPGGETEHMLSAKTIVRSTAASPLAVAASALAFAGLQEVEIPLSYVACSSKTVETLMWKQ